jgi:uncharacterized protein (TIGR02246 family)
MRHYMLAMTAVAVAFAPATLAIGADEPPGQVTAGAAAKVVAVSLVADWNNHDMKSFAELFAEDADFVNVIGLWWHGRPEIQKEHEALHATRMRNSNLIAAETAVRLLRSDVALVHVRWQLTGDTGLDGVTLPPRQGVLSFVTVRAGGKWLIASAQNTDLVPLPNVPPPR